MVSYWKTKEAVEAKVTTAKEGHDIMWMQGEKYPFMGYPRGVLLFGPLSPLKHQIKNKIFNETWKKLDDNASQEEIMSNVRTSLDEVFTLAEKGRLDMVPYEKLCPPVKELWRSFEVVESKVGLSTAIKVRQLKEIMCFILQEDDAYRMRFQWIVKFFSFWRKPTIKDFDRALSMLEQGEMVGDMKERARLLKRVLLYVLNDEGFRECFEILFKEINWKKLKLTKGDKYFFRAKYFKVDWPAYQY